MPRKRRASVHAALLRQAHKDGTYDRMLEEQGGVCAICGKPNNADRKMDLDHNHSTMKIRGVLHRGCNMRLRRGMTSEWLYQAARYLEKNGE